MTTKKIIACIVAIIIVAIIAIGIHNKNATPTIKQEVKIGLSLPLTGNVAFLGEPARQAAELALKDAGNTKYDYKLVFEDDQFNPVKAASAANKLISIDQVLAIISFGSGTGDAINSIAENNKTTQFSLASDPTAAKGDYNYIHWTPPFKEGTLLAQELVKRGYKKIAIIDTNHPGPLAVTKSIKDSLVGSSAQIVSYDLTNIGDKDFRTIIKKVGQEDADIVVLEMFSPEIEIAAKQMKELGVKVPVTSVETMEWSSNPELFEGNWFVSDSIVPAFQAKFKSAYGTDPKSGSSYVYDLVSMLIRLQESKNEPIQHADLPNVIKSMGEWDSPVFGKIQIDKDGFFLTEPSVKIIKEGKVVSA